MMGKIDEETRKDLAELALMARARGDKDETIDLIASHLIHLEFFGEDIFAFPESYQPF